MSPPHGANRGTSCLLAGVARPQRCGSKSLLVLEDAESTGQAEKHWPNLVRHHSSARTGREDEKHRVFHLRRLESQQRAVKHPICQRLLHLDRPVTFRRLGSQRPQAFSSDRAAWHSDLTQGPTRFQPKRQLVGMTFGSDPYLTKRHRRSNVGSEARQSLLDNKLLPADCRRPGQSRSTPSHATMHRQLVKRQPLNRPRSIDNRRINLHTR